MKIILVAGLTHRIRQWIIELRCLRWMYCALCTYCSVLQYLSLSYTPSHTNSSHLTRENIHCQCEKWSGTDGIRMIETTYNGSHNFPIFLPPSLSPCSYPTIHASSEPLHCHPGTQFLPKEPRLTGSPTVLHKVSQEEKDRREENKRWRKEVFSLLTWNLWLILAALFFSPAHSYVKVSVDLCLNVKSWKIMGA